MKKGFTLVEILSVIIIIGVIGLIVFPTVSSMIKNSKEDLYNKQIEEIKLASEKWAYNNIKLLPSEEGKSITITLLELKRNGYLPLDIRNPRTDKLLSNSLRIVITYKDNDYIYTIEEPITNTEITEESPSIVLGDNAVISVEINTKYEPTIVTATDKDKNDISDNIITTYYANGKEVANIDTSSLKTYTIEYSVTDEALTTIITQTVIIVDTIKPVIKVPKPVTISSSEASSFNLLKDVTVSDNSKEKIKLQVSGFDTSVGLKEVYYTGCDSSGNCGEAYREITIK